MREFPADRPEKPRSPQGWVAPMELDPERAALAVADEPAGGAAIEGEAPLPLTGSLPGQPSGQDQPRGRVGRWLAGAVTALVLVALGFDTADLLGRAFATSLALGVGVALLVATAGGAALGLLVNEVRSLRRLRRIEALRADADRIVADPREGQAVGFAGAVAKLYGGRPDLAPLLARLRDQVTDAHDDAEIVRLLEREVLKPLDRVAYQMVLRASRDTAVATALSPAAVLDLAVVLWRNLKLVREIAALYGARPGYVGTLQLFRRMLGNIAVAGVAESAHHVAVEALGGTLVAAVSARMGQGVINGLLTARVGLTAMHLCRPIAFAAGDRPSLNRIRKELLSLPKEIL